MKIDQDRYIKVVHYLIDGNYDDLYGEDWSETASDEETEALEEKLDAFKRELCGLYGCLPIQDHCGKPEHDYCFVCNTLTPGQAKR